jgi:hypothetical protein
MAISCELCSCTSVKYAADPPTAAILSLDGGALPTREHFDLTKEEVEIAKLRGTLDQLLEDNDGGTRFCNADGNQTSRPKFRRDRRIRATKAEANAIRKAVFEQLCSADKVTKIPVCACSTR